MKVTSLKTSKIRAGNISLLALIDQSLPTLEEKSILAITSKIVSLCENSVVPIDAIDKQALVISESDFFLPETIEKYGFSFTIANHTLIPMAGIDQSNGDGNYVLWPKDPQKTANQVRRHLAERFKLNEVGVIITDSTCQPMRLGTAGISIAHSGFATLTDYVGTPDLFGRPLEVTQANLVGGLAAAAVLVMGEGAEQTPLCLISDLSFIKFQPRDPTLEEIEGAHIKIDDDIFAPFLNGVKWQKGKRGQS